MQHPLRHPRTRRRPPLARLDRRDGLIAHPAARRHGMRTATATACGAGPSANDVIFRPAPVVSTWLGDRGAQADVKAAGPRE